MNKLVILTNLASESVRRPAEHSGLAYLDAYIKSSGYDSIIFDAYALNISINKSKNELFKILLKNKEKKLYIGFSPYVTSYKAMKEVGIFIKKNFENSYIFAGGHFASLHKEELLDENNWLDSVIVGEGEKTLLDLISSENPEKKVIKGLYQRNSIFIKRERITNLDILPFQTRYFHDETIPYSITTSRGCYGNCTFCSIKNFYKLNEGPTITYKSAKSVVNEISYLMKNFNAKSFKIIDDNFFRVNDSNNEFLNEMVKRISLLEKKPIFRISARPNDLTKENCKLLKKIGVEVIAIGAESSNKSSLNLYNKQITVNDTVNAIELINLNQMKCLVNFIMFDPLINLSELRNNLEFIKEISNESIFHRINSHLWLIEPTQITKILRKKGIAGKAEVPYVKYKYKHGIIKEIKDFYDNWCLQNMDDYYGIVEQLMAPYKRKDQKLWDQYQKILNKDIQILDKLISLGEKNKLNIENVRKIFSLNLKNKQSYDIYLEEN